MKTTTLLSNGMLSSLCAALIMLSTPYAHAQNQLPAGDIPRTISYQGILTGTNGSPVIDGTYHIIISLYADPTGTVKIWQDSYDASVKNGLFNLYLGGGSLPLPDATTMNRSLWIGTRIDDGPEMYPLTPLSASAYALNVSDKAITADKLADGAVTPEKIAADYIGGIAVNGLPITAKGTVLNLEGSEDIALTYNDATNTLRLSRPSPAMRSDDEKGTEMLAASDVVWSLNGDGWDISSGTSVAPAAGDWIGTSSTSGATFEVRANGQTITRYQPSGTNTPNIVAGYGGNSITSASVGSVIASGGEPGAPNQITTNASFSAIGGGKENSVSSNRSVVAGGEKNRVNGDASVIAGGDSNTVDGGNSAISGGSGNLITGNNSTIAGGGAHNSPNVIDGDYSFIGAGQGNSITINGFQNAIIAGGYNFILDGVNESMIGTGDNNVVHSGSDYSFIGAGSGNHLYTSSPFSFIGAGQGNRLEATYSAIVGGSGNTIQTGNSIGFIGGGEMNEIDANGIGNFIGGGTANKIWSDLQGNVIAGGSSSNIYASSYSVVSGGRYHYIGFGTPNGANQATIGGGEANNAEADYVTIGGGRGHTASAEYGTISGGEINVVSGTAGFVGAGTQNRAQGQRSVIAGGYQNTVLTDYSVIGGGQSNTTTAFAGGTNAVIGGGRSNTTGGDYATVGGGDANTADGDWSTVAGGEANTAPSIHSTVGGGLGNRVGGNVSTIPGGDNLKTSGYAQTAVGYFNATRGTRIARLNAAQTAATNDPLFTVGNGDGTVTPAVPSNAFEVSYNGHSVVYDVNGTSQSIVPGSRTPYRGATYVDNVIYAWGDINGNATVNGDFGVATVANPAVGTFTVTISVNDPQTGAPVTLNSAAIVATLSAEGPTAQCSSIAVSRIGVPGPNQFQVYINGSNCQAVNLPFMFHLTGRP